ncbi:hypothetical protein QE152_g10704 [Popillia japonica]|uniref:Uncharacterized protein n=1 Tax=Popillia japonica TaxID=7064 RepID=A0AAW1LSV1_POPJA
MYADLTGEERNDHTTISIRMYVCGLNGGGEDTNCVFAKFSAQQEAGGTFKYVCDLQDLRVRTERSSELTNSPHSKKPEELLNMYAICRICVCEQKGVAS